MWATTGPVTARVQDESLYHYRQFSSFDLDLLTYHPVILAVLRKYSSSGLCWKCCYISCLSWRGQQSFYLMTLSAYRGYLVASYHCSIWDYLYSSRELFALYHWRHRSRGHCILTFKFEIRSVHFVLQNSWELRVLISQSFIFWSLQKCRIWVDCLIRISWPYFEHLSKFLQESFSNITHYRSFCEHI